MNEFITVRRKIGIFIRYPHMTVGTVYLINFVFSRFYGVGNSGNILFVAMIAIKIVNCSFHYITRIIIFDLERKYVEWELLKQKQEP